MHKIALIAAMEEEIAPIIDKYQPRIITTINQQTIYLLVNDEIELYIFNTGIGKTNAAITTALSINQFQFDLIINIGTCGGLAPQICVGDFILADRLAYFDVDATSFGYDFGQVPQTSLYQTIDVTPFKSWLTPLNLATIHQGTLLTGDSFIDDHNRNTLRLAAFNNPLGVEMESMSIVYTAHQLDIPIYVLRTVSDNAQNQSNITFDQYLTDVSQKYLVVCEALLTRGEELID